jgi:hypothetical protein
MHYGALAGVCDIISVHIRLLRRLLFRTIINLGHAGRLSMPRARAGMSSLGTVSDAIARVGQSEMVWFLLNG